MIDLPPDQYHAAFEPPELAAEPFSDIFERTLALYDTGLPPGDSTGWTDVDKYFTVQTGHQTIVTGIPSMGKSEWVDALSVNLAEGPGSWQFCFYSPENKPTQIHTAKLASKRLNLPFAAGYNERMTKDALKEALLWIDDHYVWLDPRVKTCESLVQAALRYRRQQKFAVVMDPWSNIEHRVDPDQNGTDYILQQLVMLRDNYCRREDFHLFIVAHPKMMGRDPKTGERPVPTPYDISGSAHWHNTPDNCLCVHRNVTDEFTRVVSVHVQKIRHKNIGRIGKADICYDRVTGRYKDQPGGNAPASRGTIDETGNF